MSQVDDLIESPDTSYGKREICPLISYICSGYNKKGYRPDYVLGITMGVNFAVWRDILGIIDDYDSKHQIFNNSLLIYQNQFEKDTDPERDGWVVSEKYKYYGVSPSDLKGLLHTKLILIKMVSSHAMSDVKNEQEKDKYILLVSTKNISDNNSFDLIFPLFSVVEPKKTSETHGKQIVEYVKYLLGERFDSKDKALNPFLELLEKYDFKAGKGAYSEEASTTENISNNMTLDDIYFSYPGHWFPKKLREEILSCNFIISPFIDAKTFRRVKDNEKITLISYIKTYQNIKDEIPYLKDSLLKLDDLLKHKGSPKVDDFRFVTGNDHRFHAKLYIDTDKETTNVNNKTITVYVGSANLTEAALGGEEKDPVNTEMIVKIRFMEKDNPGTFKYLKNEVFNPNNNKKTLKFLKMKDLTENADTDGEEEDFFEKKREHIGKHIRYAVEYSKELPIRLLYVDKNKMCVIDYRYIDLRFWIEDRGDLIYLCKEVYLSDDEIDELNKKNDIKPIKWNDLKRILKDETKEISYQLDYYSFLRSGRHSGNDTKEINNTIGKRSNAHSVSGLSLISKMQDIMCKNLNNETDIEDINFEGVEKIRKTLDNYLKNKQNFKCNYSEEDKAFLEDTKKYLEMLNKFLEGEKDDGKE